MKRTTVIRLVGLAVMQLAPVAHAFTTNGWWNQNQVGLNASGTTFPPGDPYRSALGDTVNRFNWNPSQFRWGLHYDDGHVSTGNWESEIWATDAWQWANAPAVELTRYGLNGRIKASDIVFNLDFTDWTSSTTATNLEAYFGSGRSFQASLMHELGHGAGLGHEDDEYNVMGEATWHLHRWQDRARAYLGEDASNGLVAIYGLKSGASIEDLSVAHFEWLRALPSGSDHIRCFMYYPSGDQLPYGFFSGMLRYDVWPGQQVLVEFSYENNGESTKNGVSIGFYVSSNDLITTADQLIATRSFNLVRDDVATRTDAVTIPGDLSPGTYYLGVVVDRLGQFAEVDEDNNRAFHVIKVH